MRSRLLGMLCAFLLLFTGGGNALMEEVFYNADISQEEWYQEVLQNAQLALGNNLRLKQVIQRAQAGENITVATIGGSITEGAGAAKYAECYASRFAKGFAARYGKEDGGNVHFLNAGVGGTPSTFGFMRYTRDIVNRVKDDDGLPDLVIVEFAVNDYGEPTGGRCYESLVKTILSQPNDPAVILLFSVFKNGFNLQQDLKKVGEAYDLMMVSIKDGAYPHIDREWTKEAFFFDEYHPTSLGHAVMADCLLAAVQAANAMETSAQDVDLQAAPAFGTDFMGLQTIYASTKETEFAVSRGSFIADDTNAYSNLPVGRVCGPNFCHINPAAQDPITVSGHFKKALIAWLASGNASYGAAEILLDGQVVRTVKGAPDKWGQSEVILALDDDDKEAAFHTLEIRMTEETQNLRFTITAIGLVP